ncbi:acyl-CoA N-acyltransferase [Infundibulicybe gibba]|nr:acyl-CoA N-acyltransferase [Infundibulicybe gibba]
MSNLTTSPPEFKFHIRPAQPADVDAILELIRDLAVYEKEPLTTIKATPELLAQNLFSDTPYAHALLAITGAEGEAGGQAIGLALYFFNFSTWTGKPGLYLEDLYVRPTHRAHGVGKALFGALGRVAEDRGCARMDWSVLTWNAPSIAFYKERLKAIMMEGWVGMRLGEEGIRRLGEFR